MGGDVADLAGVLEVLPHELLDREQVLVRRITQQLGAHHLFGPVEVVLRLPRMEVQFIAQPEQELMRLAQLLPVLPRDLALPHELFRGGLPVTHKADPADQLKISQSPTRSLDVGFEQVNGATPLLLFLATRLGDGLEG